MEWNDFYSTSFKRSKKDTLKNNDSYFSLIKYIYTG